MPRSAKFIRPGYQHIYVRTLLFERLDEAQSIIWINSPPGAGKTTLVSNYITERQLPCLWYQLDSGDADVASFFYYLNLAVQQVLPAVVEPLPALTPEYLPGLPIFARRCFEQIFAHCQAGTVFVFDNYQEVAADSAFHELMREVCAALPEGIRMVLISRAEPPPAFARLQAHGAMSILDWGAMRLSLPEAQGLVGLHCAGHPPAIEQIAIWHRQTEGWLAGLLLLQAQEGQVAEGFEFQRHARSQLLFDYFAQELFAGLSLLEKQILLQTAWLPRMTVMMAAQVGEEPEAAAILARLQRKIYFLSIRYEIEPVYEYHPLFREFLLHQAHKAFDVTALNRLKTQSAQVLEQSGQLEEAAHLFYQRHHHTALSRLIVSHAQNLFMQGRNLILAQWFNWRQECGGEELSAWLWFWRGMSHLYSEPASARGDFEPAYSAFTTTADVAGLYLSWAGIVDSVYLEAQDFPRLEPWVAAFERLRTQFPDYPAPDIEFRVCCAL